MKNSKPVWRDSVNWCRVPERNQVQPQHKVRGLVIMLVLFVTALGLGILSVFV